jgi:hypothetical protein
MKVNATYPTTASWSKAYSFLYRDQIKKHVQEHGKTASLFFD